MNERLDCFIYTDFQMIVKVTNNYLELDYVDINRNNLLIPNRCVNFEKYKSCSPYYCIAARAQNKYIVVDCFYDCKNNDKNVFHFL